MPGGVTLSAFSHSAEAHPRWHIACNRRLTPATDGRMDPEAWSDIIPSMGALTMTRRQGQDSTEERTRERRYSSGQRERTREPETRDRTLDDIDALEGERGDDGVGVHAGTNLNDASLQQLHEFADELQIEDYEDMNRAQLIRAIRSRV